MTEREEKFERMLAGIQRDHALVAEQMEKLKAENKVKTATYRQLMGNKLMLESILQYYRQYGLIE